MFWSNTSVTSYYRLVGTFFVFHKKHKTIRTMGRNWIWRDSISRCVYVEILRQCIVIKSTQDRPVRIFHSNSCLDLSRRCRIRIRCSWRRTLFHQNRRSRFSCRKNRSKSMLMKSFVVLSVMNLSWGGSSQTCFSLRILSLWFIVSILFN